MTKPCHVDWREMPKNRKNCSVCGTKLGKRGGYQKTGLCAPCCTGEAETINEKYETW